MKLGLPLVAASAALFALRGTVARANGRYPAASQLVVAPLDRTRLVARTTFGVLGSADEGQSWAWVCEDAAGYYGQEDPSIALTASGAMILVSSGGVTTSVDDGCSWAHASGLSDDPFGVDVTVVSSTPHEALALVSTYRAGVYQARVVRSSDDGSSYRTTGAGLPEGFVAETLEVAPSRPERVYVSGRVLSGGDAAIGGALQRSDDAGSTWTSYPVGTAPAESIFIGAVDPTAADTVYLRTRSETTSRVLQSTDGGAIWREVWKADSPVLGLALSEDGATLAVGSPATGVLVASTADGVFEQVSAVGAQCLTWLGTRLLVCATEASDGFLLGSSDDGGRHFHPMLHQAALTPRACSAGTIAARVCPAQWPPIAAAIGASVARDAGADGSSSDARSALHAAGGCHLAPTVRPFQGGRGGGAVLIGLGLVAAVRRRARATCSGSTHGRGRPCTTGGAR